MCPRESIEGLKRVRRSWDRGTRGSEKKRAEGGAREKKEEECVCVCECE